MARPSIASALGIRTGGDPWWRRAACAGQPWSLFFHEGGSNKSDDTIFADRAKRVCIQCPVRRPCLEDALEAESEQIDTVARNRSAPQFNAGRPREKRLAVGVVGGATARERWARDVAHADDCPGGCKGCRPVADRVAILEGRLVSQSPRLLLRTESMTPLA